MYKLLALELKRNRLRPYYIAALICGVVTLSFLLCCSVLAGLLGVLSLWCGFRKKSVSVTIVAAVILASLVCQVISAAIKYVPILWAVMGISAIFSVIAALDLFHQVENMEV